MSASIEALGIDKLSVRERLHLVDEILDSLPEQVNLEVVPAWHLVELAKRRVEADAKPGEGKPWREVLAKLAERR